MSDPLQKLEREALGLRVLWMLLMVLAWKLAELVLAAVMVAQLGYRLVQGKLHPGLLHFGDSLSQYVAQLARFATFASEEKPWPFANWPAAQRPEQTEHS